MFCRLSFHAAKDEIYVPITLSVFRDMHKAFVFCIFDFKPENLLNEFRISRDFSISCLSLRKSVVSSASCLIFNFVLSVAIVRDGRDIPFIGLFLICIANHSTASTKANGEKGDPCLMPQLT